LIEESRPDVYVPNCILPAYYAAASARGVGVHTVGVLHSDDPFYWGVVDEFLNGSPGRRVSAMVAVSQFLYNAVEDSAKARNVHLRRIGCGVPVPGDIATEPQDVFRLVYTGRLVEEQKCISKVTHALCSALAKDPKLEAWIVGEGGARAELHRIIDGSGIDPQRIRLLGRVDVSGIYSILRQCHAFVLLSDYEGLPVSMLEAMAAGVVPICLDMRSGIREVISPGRNGMIVKDRGDDFRAAVDALSTDTALWSRLSAGARATIEQRFSEEACATSWIELLRSLGTRESSGPIRPPAMIRLPRRNPRFGRFDTRVSIATRVRSGMSGLRRSAKQALMATRLGARIVEGVRARRASERSRER
jgi:glycosyltransferase involved in cell wall biosynthesis